MRSRFQLGFIGFGKMARALWGGLAAQQIYNAADVCFTEVNDASAQLTAKETGLTALSLTELVRECHIVILAIKPQQLSAVLETLPKLLSSDQTWVSILAGVPIARLKAGLGNEVGLVRAMPNTPALLGFGATALSFDGRVTEEMKSAVQQIFGAVGMVVVVDESLLHAVTGLSGSGPAFLYRVAESMASAGSAHGLPDALALQLAAQTMIGAGEMLLHSGKTPGTLIAEVSSPGGTTVAGLQQFDMQNISSKLIDVVSSAIKRSQEMAKGA